jgi:phi13 family phage major tail protein
MSTQIGLSSLYYALLTADTNANATYSTPVHIPGVITANINANASQDTLFADDGPMETATSIGKIDLELDLADLPFDVQSVLLGHTLDANGILLRKSNDVPPWAAIGFKSLKTSGSYRYVWLLKGKFLIPDLTHETKADKITFQKPKFKGSFVKRDFDDGWIRQADEDATGYTATIGTNWFTDPNYHP